MDSRYAQYFNSEVWWPLSSTSRCGTVLLWDGNEDRSGWKKGAIAQSNLVTILCKTWIVWNWPWIWWNCLICNFRIFQVYKKSSTATYSDRFAYLKHVRPPIWSIECRRSTLRDNSRCTCATSPWSSAFTGGLGYCSGAMLGGWFF